MHVMAVLTMLPQIPQKVCFLAMLDSVSRAHGMGLQHVVRL